MAYSSSSTVLAVVVFAACSRETAVQRASPPAAEHAMTASEAPPPASASVVPENEADRGIRRDLNVAIAQDPQLKERQISFLVSNGDVSVTGVVKSEGERKKINDLAMNIAGVKSVANALRVAK
jgi:osmotically-inducible protein OsmY